MNQLYIAQRSDDARPRRLVARLLGVVLLAGLLLALALAGPPAAFAEGTVDLYDGQTSTSPRGLIEWRNNVYGKDTITGPTDPDSVDGMAYRRSFWRVYANAGEKINMGSSAMFSNMSGNSTDCQNLPDGPDSGTTAQDCISNIVLFTEAQINGLTWTTQAKPQDISALTPAFDCMTAAAPNGRGGWGTTSNVGVLGTRAQELAGPLPNSGGYTPCIYTAPSAGVYYVAFYGVGGARSTANAANNDNDDRRCTNVGSCPTDRIPVSGQNAAGTVGTPVVSGACNTSGSCYDANQTWQLSGVSMMDITVRNSANTTTYNGRVWTDYLAQYVGQNGTSYDVFENFYETTADGFLYSIDTNGIDPNGFLLYGNGLGFTYPDGTALYHDANATSGAGMYLNTPQAGVLMQRATSTLWFNTPDASLPTSIVPVPVVPSISSPSFTGNYGPWSDGVPSSYVSNGGTFGFTTNVVGVSQIIIAPNPGTCADAVYDSGLSTNRTLSVNVTTAGAVSVVWDGKDNAGNYFAASYPVNDPTSPGYCYKINIHSGEYHFPLLDPESSTLGGPSFTLIPPSGYSCPWIDPGTGLANCNWGFYDDRGYSTAQHGCSSSCTVGTVDVLLGCNASNTECNGPPATASDTVSGFDTTTTQRAYGGNFSNLYPWGNEKGIDTWTYWPSNLIYGQLYIIPTGVTRNSGSIGNYVWVDEDGDGDQDAGEPGIPNVKVTITKGSETYTTYTDANGGYLFTGLGSGTWTVTVDSTTLPSGLAANPTYDENGVGTAHTTSVALATGEEHLTADFGYNWSTTTETNSPGSGSTGAIGDRVWVDVDADGFQDPEEIGISGVTVQLITAGSDGVFGTSDDVTAASTSTDVNGNYIFDGLATGAYVVQVNSGATPSGYTQTGDPDHFGTTGTNDNKTTTPIVLGPGDVFINADFGYQPSGTTGSIGDTVWFDANADGTQGSGEYGIPGVTVALIKDVDGDGVYKPGTDKIIATDITNASGVYGFSGLPITDGTGTDDYLVWVNDTDHVLGELSPTYDKNGIITPYVSSVTNLGTTGTSPYGTNTVTDQDFGFAPAGQATGEGLIGDFIYLDRDGNGAYDGTDSGIENVVVRLCSTATCTSVLATTTTDENGYYSFGNLAAGSYYVDITSTANFGTSGGTMGALYGLAYSADPGADGTDNGISLVVTLASGTMVNLNQDFGLKQNGTAGSIGNLIWNDVNADGNVDTGEAGIQGVTVDLYRDLNGNGKIDSGEPKIGAATTGTNGAYSFTGLPTADNGLGATGADYIVDVTDTANVLAGYWQSYGTTATDNNSQLDTYAVSIGTGTSGQPIANNVTADFGYYVKPAAVGNYVWEDADADGIQDAGEAGINGVTVKLVITWPNGQSTTITTVTGDDPSTTGTTEVGWYSFGNLLQDEDYNGDGAGSEPTHTISILTTQAALTGYAPTTINASGSTVYNDSNDPAGTSVQPVEGVTDTVATNTTGLNAAADFGFIRATASLGNYVWLDEDGDGDQDAGEPGIPNVKVTLTQGSTTYTTYTDANGGYLFTNLKPGSYTVTVDSATLPTGLAANPTYDENGIATAHTSTGTLTSGEEHLTADFGYNWSSTAETNTAASGATGAIGDRVWVDVDSDGKQDAEEIGIQGVTVTLTRPGADGILGTSDDTTSTTTTDYNGNYIFDNLPAGAYVVTVTPPSGYTQTGDPDHFGTTNTATAANDNKTTTPIVLAPGDVFVNADFGYVPASSGSIGDTVWFNEDGDSAIDTGEYGIPGVTVALIRDLDNDGIWDAGEPIIATDITDANGNYLFSGLPVTDGTGTDDYLVWVNDTEHVLGELAANYDQNGSTPATGLVTGLGISSVSDLTTTAVTNQDFGYAPVGHLDSEGLIGDFIWFDRNEDGSYDANGLDDVLGTGDDENGIEGVIVRLCSDSSCAAVLATTVTDENGYYSFGNLAAGTYYVSITAAANTGTGGALHGMTYSDDPGTGADGVSPSITLASGATNYLQDFGLKSSVTAGSIGNLIWNDVDADGFKDTSEAGIQGVTVDLYRDLDGDKVLDPGEPKIGTATTDANGAYSFTGLPTLNNSLGTAGADYIVDVTDTAGVLLGYWQSYGATATDDNSQVDPYAVSITSGNPDNVTADFGYYVRPGALGNYVWEDVDGDGLQDADEVGIDNVVVTLVITYPNNQTTTLKTTTGDDPSTTGTVEHGWYNFGNLLLDEDHNGEGSGEPTFSISVATPANYEQTLMNQGTDDTVDSDTYAGQAATTTEGATNVIYDFGYRRILLGTIGNYVWLDEDGDGDQDAGEPGIPNVLVTLTNGSQTLTTYTDANGGYLFPDLTPGTWTVTVDESTLPAGLAANNTYNEDTGATSPDNVTTVVLASGEEHLTADFGYNWAPPADTNNPTSGSTGAIGDRVWIDADGDGVQDANEAGLAGVTVALLVDSNGDGVYGGTGDTPAVTTQTDAAGNYIFDNLAAGAYVVRVTGGTTGYTQTGDPDHFGTTGTNDNQTTTPIVLAPGDVFVDADFGYQPATGTSGIIGDTVWFDPDGNATVDSGEYGINGVTVALIKDVNGDGVYQPGTDKIIATTITGDNPATTGTVEAGWYQFTGLPVADGVGADDYLVWVTDTNNVLGDLIQSYDSDGTGTANISKVTDLAPAGNLNQDFGYKPLTHDSGEGLIGDTIFLDRTPNGTPDPGEGIEGVMVKLLDASGKIVAFTYTDENGNYFFGGLAAGTYTVVVVPATLPNGGAGLTNYTDPDNAPGAGNNQSSVTLSSGSMVNLNQDFGYRPTTAGSIGDLVWNDVDADGARDAGETGIGGVTVDLYFDKNGNGALDTGDVLIATTTTANDGSYLFSNLPTASTGLKYLVDVTDVAGKLDGYWQSYGLANTNDNSQVDPYSVTLTTASPNVLTADFGYYVKPAALGNFVWEDDGDGTQEAGEPAIPGVEVTLTIAWPNGGGSTTVKTVTDANGYYSFGNLLLDEDHNGEGTGEPTFTVSVNTAQPALAGFLTVPQNAAAEDLDSDNPAGELATVTEGAVNNTYDFGFLRIIPAAIGDRVWLDEDSDGVQDAGEDGIANVKVELYAANGTTLLATTYTDANGEYLFPDLLPGTYVVKVDPASLPAGLTANPTYDEDSGTTSPDQQTTVTLPLGVEHMTADFGYNWAATTDVNGGTGTGAIGDRVWNDVDGDGAQDADEPGIPGVTVELTGPGLDGILGTADDTTTTTVTDVNGNYIFDSLPAGVYSVEVTPPGGYAQTGDPDAFGEPCTTCDNQTTTPIVLGPGDVFVNADFGYQPPADTTGQIGDTVWLDADRDNTQDAGEPGIPGVTVALIQDANGNGVWDGGESIIATDITDEDGQYLFSGLPTGATADYLVWVNDTANVLDKLVPTYDDDGIGTPNISKVTDLTTAGDLDQDFGYAPPRQDPGEGVIGDTIFLDRNPNGAPDPGEGLEGVTVKLYADTNGDGNYDAGEPLLTSTVTDENGNYTFGGLPAGNYVVVVDPATLPAGVTNTVDPDTTNSPANESGVTLAAGEVNLVQDFGYQPTTPNTIGGTIWVDTNADGALTEPGRWAGVTVVLLDSDGNVVATTTTDANGDYSFTNLPDGTYSVDVTDEDNVLAGAWKSDCPNCGQDNNSQPDPYTVTVGPSNRNDTTADFGYYRLPAALGNFVWEDQNGNGIQDPGEPAIPGVEVTLTITWPGDGTTVLKTTTDGNGLYSFGNLLLDEDFDGVGTGEPTYAVTVATPANYAATSVDQGIDDGVDSDASGVAATVTEGTTNTIYDFGFLRFGRIVVDKVTVPAGAGHVFNFALTGGPANVNMPFPLTDAATPWDSGPLLPGLTYKVQETIPAGWTLSPAVCTNGANQSVGTVNLQTGEITGITLLLNEVVTCVFTNNSGPLAVDLASFSADSREDGIHVAWETVSETDLAGFNVYRAESLDGEWTLLNPALITSQAPGSSQGSAYEWLDAVTEAGKIYYYQLEDISTDGSATRHAPVQATPVVPNAVGLNRLAAVPVAPLAAPAALGVLILLGGAAVLARRKK